MVHVTTMTVKLRKNIIQRKGRTQYRKQKLTTIVPIVLFTPPTNNQQTGSSTQNDNFILINLPSR